MANTKITITLREDQIEEIRAMVAGGAASSVSAFVQHAVGVALYDAAAWKEMLEDALLQTGGSLTKKERAWPMHISPRTRSRELLEKERPRNGTSFDAGGLSASDRDDRRVLALIARATQSISNASLPGFT